MCGAWGSRDAVLPKEEEEDALQEDVLPVVEEGGVLVTVEEKGSLPRVELDVLLPWESRVVSVREGWVSTGRACVSW